MLCRLFVCLMSLTLVASASAATAAEPAKSDSKSEWTNLIAKGDLSKHWETKGNWKQSDDGVITLTPRPGESGWTRYDMYLWGKETYGDFEIEFEYSVQKNGNSGFYFHVGDVKNPVATGVEVQIYDSFSKKETDKLNDHDSGGIIPGFAPTKRVSKAPGEFNKFLITVKGNKCTVVLNGEQVNEVDLSSDKLKSRPAKGAIGFQDHGLPLSLRNIRIRAL